MGHLAIAFILGSAVLCFGQSAPSTGTICGHVDRADTRQPLSGVTVVAENVASRPPFPTQTTAADGSFCFRSLPASQYYVLAFKPSFVLLLRGRDARIAPAHPNPVLQMEMAPTLPVTSAKEALDSALTPEQRKDLEFEGGSFSPDGRYFAISVNDSGEDSSWGGQVLRYDFMTKKILAVTPEPTAHTLPEVGVPPWKGDVLYSTVTHTWGVGRNFFYKTEGDTTTLLEASDEIDTYNAFQPPPSHPEPPTLRVGPYVVDEDISHAGTELSIGKTDIANLDPGQWVTLDDPPVIIYYGDLGLDVFYLKTRRRQAAMVTNYYGIQVLAAMTTPSGFRVAYAVGGECDVDPSTLSPDFTPSGDLSWNLCFVDVPDESQPVRPAHAAASK